MSINISVQVPPNFLPCIYEVIPFSTPYRITLNKLKINDLHDEKIHENENYM
jgi:hypothetical protein